MIDKERNGARRVPRTVAALSVSGRVGGGAPDPAPRVKIKMLDGSMASTHERWGAYGVACSHSLGVGQSGHDCERHTHILHPHAVRCQPATPTVSTLCVLYSHEVQVTLMSVHRVDWWFTCMWRLAWRTAPVSQTLSVSCAVRRGGSPLRILWPCACRSAKTRECYDAHAVTSRH